MPNSPTHPLHTPYPSRTHVLSRSASLASRLAPRLLILATSCRARLSQAPHSSSRTVRHAPSDTHRPTRTVRHAPSDRQLSLPLLPLHLSSALPAFVFPPAALWLSQLSPRRSWNSAAASVSALDVRSPRRPLSQASALPGVRSRRCRRGTPRSSSCKTPASRGSSCRRRSRRS